MKEQPPFDLKSESDPPNDFFRSVNIQFLIHELKGPLDVIQTNIRMLLEMKESTGRLTPLQEKALKRSNRSAAKMRNIIHSLLEVGRSQTGRIHVEEFELMECAYEILENSLETVICGEIDTPETDTDPVEFLSRHNIHLTSSPEAQNAVLRQDKTKFKYILGNLVRNGLSHRHSYLEVDLKLTETDLLIAISDDGPGFALQDHKMLFKRYTQNRDHCRKHHKGHGLGLASSRIMARYLGGDVTVISRSEAGACFLLKLPLQLDPKAAQLKGVNDQ